MKSRIGVCKADSCNHHTFLGIRLYLAQYYEQCTISMVNTSWCAWCKIRQDDIPIYTCWPRCCHHQWYYHFTTAAAIDMGCGSLPAVQISPMSMQIVLKTETNMVIVKNILKHIMVPAGMILISWFKAKKILIIINKQWRRIQWTMPNLWVTVSF